MERRSERVRYEFLYLRENVSLHVEVQVWLLGVYDFCEVLETHLVRVFKLTVVLRFVLDGVIGQMDESVAHVVEVVFARTRPHVPILVAVPFQRAVNAGQHSIDSEIEFSLVHQKRVVDVLLNYEGAVLSGFSLNNLLYLFHVFDNLDALASVSVFTRLDDPQIYSINDISFIVFAEISKSAIIHAFPNVESQW